MNALKNKIKSQRGASITFALLLFLVCAVVSIVVVVAGSAAAGRMSQRAETDQRYYAVTSAVELLCDDFKGMEAEVQYTKDPVNPLLDADIIAKVWQKDDATKTDVSTTHGILTAASKTLVKKIINSPDDNSDVDTGADDTLTLTATGAPDKSALACTIKEYVKKDGRVVFEVSNTGDPTVAKYTLQAVFDARITQSTSQYIGVDGDGKPKKMDRGTVKLEWSLSGIVKGVYMGV